MGWGRTLLLGDIGNRLDIGDCERELQSIKNSLRRNIRTDQYQEDDILRLQTENDELKLVLAALARLLVTKGVITAEELERFVKIIDAEDGTADGKTTSKIV